MYSYILSNVQYCTCSVVRAKEMHKNVTRSVYFIPSTVRRTSSFSAVYGAKKKEFGAFPNRSNWLCTTLSVVPVL